MDESVLTARQMPHDENAEKSVLGAMLYDREAISSVMEIINSEDFYRSDYGMIYDAILEVYNSSETVDPVTVSAKLQEKNAPDQISSIEYLAQLIAFVPSSVGAESYANIVKKESLRRNIIKVNHDIENDCYSSGKNIDDLIEDTEKKIMDLIKNRSAQDVDPIAKVVNDAIYDIEKNYKNNGEVTGIPTGFIDLDRKTAGFHAPELLIIAARPAMGKTAFVLNIAQNVCIKNRMPAVFFSLEMSSQQLVNRLLSLESGVDAEKIKTGKLQDDDWQQLIEGSFNVGSCPLIIDDTPGMTLSMVKSKCRRYKARNNIQCVIIDYLQLLEKGGRIESRQQEISEISRALKSLARELDVPVIALSQLSRSVESRPDKRPMLSDLRESGAIEQDADVVMFIYRDDYYNEDSEEKGISEIIIAKQRSGETGTVKLRWIKERTKFANLLTEQQEARF